MVGHKNRERMQFFSGLQKEKKKVVVTERKVEGEYESGEGVREVRFLIP